MFSLATQSAAVATFAHADLPLLDSAELSARRRMVPGGTFRAEL
jgi:hypothetical protein